MEAIKARQNNNEEAVEMILEANRQRRLLRREQHLRSKQQQLLKEQQLLKLKDGKLIPSCLFIMSLGDVDLFGYCR